jgi:hypothetical protein
MTFLLNHDSSIGYLVNTEYRDRNTRYLDHCTECLDGSWLSLLVEYHLQRRIVLVDGIVASVSNLLYILYR